MEQASYSDFLSSKRNRTEYHGIAVDDASIHPMLYPFQRDIVRWACHKGRCAIFLDTGLGKTFIQLEWARLLGERTIIIAPLSVTRQTIREAAKIGIEVKYIRSMTDVEGMFSICNYEMIDALNFSAFGAIVLDESSILKSIGGVTRRTLTDRCQSIKYRLCCTATPAPNDQSEIGNHAEFLGICKGVEMLAMFFIHANKQDEREESDGSITRKKHSNKQGQEWRLKNHARGKFYEWMASWAIAMTRPGELGYSDEGYTLPKLTIEPVIVESDYVPDGELFHSKLSGITDRTNVRRSTIPDRLDRVDGVMKKHTGQWIIWAGLQAETDALSGWIRSGRREVKGDDPQEQKITDLQDFQDGQYDILITKPKICGFGMNFQNAHNMIFFGLSDSWESYYQCIRREWRYGQKRPVNVYIIMSAAEQEIWDNVKRKERVAKLMTSELLKNIKVYERRELGMERGPEVDGEAFCEPVTGSNFKAIHGDSCLELPKIAENSIDLSVYSPPFADLYTYTNSEKDLGNSKDWGEFFTHYSFIIREVLRVTKPGRLTCVHSSDIPAMEVKDGYIGMKDFPGEVVRAYEREGWVFVGRAFIQKNPQAQAIRVKSKALLFAQLRKDSSHSRPAIIDQILIFKKPGENNTQIRPVENGEMDNETWINWAHGIWFGIQESDVLRYGAARDADDEKHICPLQLGVIERCIKLYSNPGETVLTPFMGIGSEIYQAVRFRRNGIGIELKKSYFKIAVQNLEYAQRHFIGQDLFATNGVAS
jgi:DNA modification methylase